MKKISQQILVVCFRVPLGCAISKRFQQILTKTIPLCLSVALIFSVLCCCVSSEVRSQRCEETQKVGQDEQRGHSLCLLHSSH